MTDPEPSYTEDAHIAFLMALRDEPDFPGWFTRVLCAVAADLGSSDVLTGSHPDSWEAECIKQHVKGTVGYDDNWLDDYKRSP